MLTNLESRSNLLDHNSLKTTIRWKQFDFTKARIYKLLFLEHCVTRYSKFRIYETSGVTDHPHTDTILKMGLTLGGAEGQLGHVMGSNGAKSLNDFSFESTGQMLIKLEQCSSCDQNQHIIRV